jgi:hypothetical protein
MAAARKSPQGRRYKEEDGCCCFEQKTDEGGGGAGEGVCEPALVGEILTAGEQVGVRQKGSRCRSAQKELMDGRDLADAGDSSL